MCHGNTFASTDRFRLPQQGRKSCCSCLKIDDDLVSDPTELVTAWINYFSKLVKPQVTENPDLQLLKDSVDSLHASSLGNKEPFLDIPFSAEEIENVIRRMKLRKSAGPNQLVAVHLRFGGSSLQMWLRNIFNAIIEIEQIPDVLNVGAIVPIYKGKGKDPTSVDSYRGITVNSVLTKMLEYLVLERMKPLFLENHLPHPNQTAYRKQILCADAIFATLESINRYMRQESKVFMALYDLEKAFDSVEVPVLLSKLFEAGVDSRADGFFVTGMMAAVG